MIQSMLRSCSLIIYLTLDLMQLPCQRNTESHLTGNCNSGFYTVECPTLVNIAMALTVVMLNGNQF